MQEHVLKTILEQVDTMAVVGAKDTAGHPVDRVGRYLLEAGYRIFPVHPKRKEVWGIPAFSSLPEIRERVDAVVLFRAFQYCPAHAAEAVRRLPLPRLFWMQQGIRSEAASALLAEHGVPVIEDACLMVEHARLFSQMPIL